MKIYTIVVTYNAEEHLKDCIGGLLQSSCNSEIIVVDNCSKDRTVKLIRKDYPSVILLPQKTNLGFGKANNIGISYALENDANFVFLLNQDAYVFPNTINRLIDTFLKGDDSLGVLSPIHLNESGSDLDPNWKEYYFTPETCPSYFQDDESTRKNKTYTVDFVNAAAWMISSDCLKKVGGFNTFFFMYSEDYDFVNRLHYKGYKLEICPASEIRHTRTNSESRNTQRDKLFFLKKFYNEAAIQLMNPSNSMIYGYLHISWLSVKRSVGNFLRGRFREGLFHFFLPCRIFFNILKMRSFRMESKKSSMAHL